MLVSRDIGFGTQGNKNSVSVRRISGYHKQKLNMKKYNKIKAQFAIEFILLLVFMFIVFLGITTVITSKVLDSKEAANQLLVEDLATLAKNEIDLAMSASNGYTRTFTLPVKLEGNAYGITILGNRELVVTYLDKEHILFLQENIIGDLNPGANTIRKEAGIVYVNN